MRPPNMTTPPGSGAASLRARTMGGGTLRIIPHLAADRHRDDALAGVCRRTLHDLATARREYRDAITPDMPDALDIAMESLRTALTIAELETDHE